MAGLGSLLSKSNGDKPEDTNDVANESNNESNVETTTKDDTAADFGNAEDSVGSEDGDREPKLIATSAPIQRFKIGRFQFERGVLHLYDDKDVEDFRNLVKQLPPVDRNQIKIIDKEAAEALVRPIEPGATKQFDSSVGRQRERAATGEKVIGDDPLDPNVGGQGEKFAKVAQSDANRPVAGVEPKHVVNDVNQGDVDKTAEQRAEQQNESNS